MASRKTELKVGLLVLFSLALLGGFVFVLGNFSTREGFTFYVDFDFVGNLAKGAPVKVSGIKVGKVQEIRFLAGKLDPKTKRRVYVRLKLWVEERARPAIRTNSEFYINTEGVLGEQYVEITPGTHDEAHPPVRNGQVLVGKAPPRADLIVSRLYDFLNTATEILQREKDNIGTALRNATRAAATANDILSENRQDIHELLVSGRNLAQEAEKLARSARRGLGDGSRLARILARSDKLLGRVSARLDPTWDKVDTALDEATRLARLVGPKERDKVLATLDRVVRLSKKADRLMSQVLDIVRAVRKGKGTAGALVMNREIYEDLKELVRDLRRNPWKFFWKE